MDFYENGHDQLSVMAQIIKDQQQKNNECSVAELIDLQMASDGKGNAQRDIFASDPLDYVEPELVGYDEILDAIDHVRDSDESLSSLSSAFRPYPSIVSSLKMDFKTTQGEDVHVVVFHDVVHVVNRLAVVFHRGRAGVYLANELIMTLREGEEAHPHGMAFHSISCFKRFDWEAAAAEGLSTRPQVAADIAKRFNDELRKIRGKYNL